MNASVQVVLHGLSYEAGAATFTLAKQHPAVQCAVLMYPFWDLFTDVSCPGGVPHKRFVQNWDAVCCALDANRLEVLGKVLRIPFMYDTNSSPSGLSSSPCLPEDQGELLLGCHM